MPSFTMGEYSAQQPGAGGVRPNSELPLPNLLAFYSLSGPPKRTWQAHMVAFGCVIATCNTLCYILQI